MEGRGGRGGGEEGLGVEDGMVVNWGKDVGRWEIEDMGGEDEEGDGDKRGSEVERGVVEYMKKVGRGEW